MPVVLARLEEKGTGDVVEFLIVEGKTAIDYKPGADFLKPVRVILRDSYYAPDMFGKIAEWMARQDFSTRERIQCLLQFGEEERRVEWD